MLTRSAAVCAAASVAVLMVGSSASAQTRITTDKVGDVSVWSSSTQKTTQRRTNVDIERMKVSYGAGALVVRTKFRDLTKTNTTITARVTSLHDYWFDTNPKRSGYEYRIFDARDENLHRIRRGKADDLVRCKGLSWKADLKADVTTVVIPRSCFAKGERQSVRVKFQIQQTGPGRTPAGGGSYFMDTMVDAITSGTVRHG